MRRSDRGVVVATRRKRPKVSATKRAAFKARAKRIGTNLGRHLAAAIRSALKIRGKR